MKFLAGPYELAALEEDSKIAFARGCKRLWPIRIHLSSTNHFTVNSRWSPLPVVFLNSSEKCNLARRQRIAVRDNIFVQPYATGISRTPRNASLPWKRLWLCEQFLQDNPSVG
jgi:hypothetical protein